MPKPSAFPSVRSVLPEGTLPIRETQRAQSTGAGRRRGTRADALAPRLHSEWGVSATPDRWSGTERCGFCLQRYRFELEVHCVRCDRPACPLCVARARTGVELWCVECTGAEGGARDGGR